MGLKLKLNPKERVVINGCIIRNKGHRQMEIEIENRADVLRASEMLDAESAQTPATRLCYLIQIALVSPYHRARLIKDIRTRIEQLRDVMTHSHGPRLEEIGRLVEVGEFYMASRKLQPVIAHEALLLSMPQPSVQNGAVA